MQYKGFERFLLLVPLRGLSLRLQQSMISFLQLITCVIPTPRSSRAKNTKKARTAQAQTKASAEAVGRLQPKQKVKHSYRQLGE